MMGPEDLEIGASEGTTSSSHEASSSSHEDLTHFLHRIRSSIADKESRSFRQAENSVQLDPESAPPAATTAPSVASVKLGMVPRLLDFRRKILEATRNTPLDDVAHYSAEKKHEDDIR